MSRRIRALALAAVLSLTATTACTLDGPTSPTSEASSGESWTILMYSIADTDLEPFMMVDLEELGSIAGDPDLHISALVDRAGEYSDAAVLGLNDWEGAKLLHLDTPGEATVVEDLGDVNTGDPVVLANFITQGIQRNPADHYALIMSDHGASWPGIGADESAGQDVLTLADLDQGIGEGLARAGVDKLDLLGIDACLMATYEVASILQSHADRLLASQELEPGHGWDYRSLAVAADGATVDELGAQLIEGYAAQARQQQTDAAITLALIDLTKMPELDSAIQALSQALTDRVATVAPAVGRTLAQTLGFGRNPDPLYDSYMSDLGILAGELSVDAVDVAPQAEDVVRAVNDIVLATVDGQATNGATGLSIYFPTEGGYYNPAYADLDLNTGWNAFLERYYTAGSEIPVEEQAAFVEGEATIQFADNGVYIGGDFEPAAQGNIASAYTQYGFWTEDGSLALFGDEDASYAPDGSTFISAFYDLTMLQVSDGVDTMSAYLSLSYSDEGLMLIDVPMIAQAQDDTSGATAQDIILELGVDPPTGDIVSEVYYALQETGMYGEWTPPENTLLFPTWLYVDGEGNSYWAPTEGPGLYAELANLQYNLVPIDPGTEFWLSLTAVDFGGNEDFVYSTITVP